MGILIDAMEVVVELETVYQIIDIHLTDVRKVEIFDICRVVASTKKSDVFEYNVLIALLLKIVLAANLC